MTTTTTISGAALSPFAFGTRQCGGSAVAGHSRAMFNEETGQDPTAPAVASVAAHETVTAPIISARSFEQFTPSLAALDMIIDATACEIMANLTSTPTMATDRTETQ